MSKIKIKKGSVHLDMTAMCDVAFLLLTFFILTAKAKPMEPVEVMIPSSIVDLPVPEKDIITLFIDDKGRAFIGMDNNNNARVNWIDNLSTQYKFSLNETQRKNFINGGVLPVNASQLPQYLEADANTKKAMEKASKGIPVDTSNTESNELKNWILTARSANQMANASAGSDQVAKVVIKADSKAPYSVIKQVMKTLQNQGVDRFSLLTTQAVG